jgi:DNA invertase Pin-like site-specific DNA recombinase
MSTGIQLKGDSLRRQLEASEKYAQANDLQLVDAIEGIPLKDIGVSGYRGANSKDGVLAKFLEHLEQGKIEGGSILLVESLDRLSRNAVVDALQQFISIVSYDIEIVTLADGQRYTKQSLNENASQLFVSLGIMMRANEESAIKAKRLKASWDNKRRNAARKPLTSIAPAWLAFDKETGKFEVVEDRATVVKTMFEMCAHVCGHHSIVKCLNEKQIPPFAHAQFWQLSYVKKILKNRAVLGEYQPHAMVEGKRQPAGEPIPDYFPRIIDDELFHLASAATKRRTVNGSGRKGNTYANLLTGLTYCGSCGAKMTLRNRGGDSGAAKTLVCARAKVKGGCNTPEWRYESVERNLVKHLREIDFSELLGNKNVGVEIENQLVALKNQRDEKQTNLNKFLDLFQSEQLLPTAMPSIVDRVNSIGQELADIDIEVARKQAELDEHQSQITVFREDAIKQALLALEEKKDDYFFRSSINQLLGKSIAGIDLIVDDLDYHPFEVEEGDSIVASFRELHPELDGIDHEHLVDRKDFKNYWGWFQKRIRVRYKTGAVRHLLVGYDVSFETETYHVQYKDELGQFIAKEEAEKREPGTFKEVLVKRDRVGRLIG